LPVNLRSAIIIAVLAKCDFQPLIFELFSDRHGLDVVHFDFVGGGVLKNLVVILQVKNRIFYRKVEVATVG